MDWDQIDWDALSRMREEFLAGSAGRADYWRSECDLASYDLTFAARIGWKWDFVLGELARRGWSPPRGPLLDFGCGSGIAARRCLAHFAAGSVSEVLLHDRSPLAMQFAAARVAEQCPQTPVRATPTIPADTPFATLLVSHVITELRPAQMESLVRLAPRAEAIVWVEPGTFAASRALVAARERLRETLPVVAPCTRQQACPLLAADNESHWCHQFAEPPPEVFTDSQWVRFGRAAGIDLRSLPTSFLVLDRRGPRDLPGGATRTIGRPRVGKAFATIFGCNSDGLAERRLTKRDLPEAFRAFRHGDYPSLAAWRCDGDRIVEIQTV